MWKHNTNISAINFGIIRVMFDGIFSKIQQGIMLSRLLLILTHSPSPLHFLFPDCVYFFLFLYLLYVSYMYMNRYTFLYAHTVMQITITIYIMLITAASKATIIINMMHEISLKNFYTLLSKNHIIY